MEVSTRTDSINEAVEFAETMDRINKYITDAPSQGSDTESEDNDSEKDYKMLSNSKLTPSICKKTNCLIM